MLGLGLVVSTAGTGSRGTSAGVVPFTGSGKSAMHLSDMSMPSIEYISGLVGKHLFKNT